MLCSAILLRDVGVASERGADSAVAIDGQLYRMLPERQTLPGRRGFMKSECEACRGGMTRRREEVEAKSGGDLNETPGLSNKKG